MMWHTSLPLKIQVKKVIFVAFLALSLLGSGAYSCGGSGGPGGGTPGGGGGAGAPPIAIPGPEALNMEGITISAPDSAGAVTVSGTSGTAASNADVRVRNIGPQVSWYQKAILNSAYAAVGDEVIVKANGAGAFSLQIRAVVGDRLGIAQKVSLKPVFSAELMGTVQAVPSQPTGFVPAGEAKPFMKSKMVSDPNGNILSIQGSSASSRKWKWSDLFISTAYAAEEASVQNALEVNCPQAGPCQLQASKNAHDGYCTLSKADSKGTDMDKDLQIPYCRSPNDLQFVAAKGAEPNWLFVVAGKNAIFMKEASPDKWIVTDVLRFENTISNIQPDYQANDLVAYLMAPKGFYLFNTKTKALTYIPTKVGSIQQNSILPTTFTKKGSHIVYALWMNNEATLYQGDVVRDPLCNLQRELKIGISHPILETIILNTEGLRQANLQSGKISYQVNRYAFIAGKKVYIIEVPTYASYIDLNNELAKHPDLNISNLEKAAAVDFPDAAKDFTMMADDPNSTILAISDGEKVYYVDYNFGETVPLLATRVTRVTDLKAEGSTQASVLIYNPVSRSFMLRGTEITPPAVSNTPQANSVPAIRPRTTSISLFDPVTPDASSRSTPREEPSSREEIQINVRSSVSTPLPSSTTISPGTSSSPPTSSGRMTTTR